MSFTSKQSVLILAGAFGVGALAGWLEQTKNKEGTRLAFVEGAEQSGGAISKEPGSAHAPEAQGEASLPLANQSEREGFGDFELSKQADVLRRLSGKAGSVLPPSSLALLAKIVPQLSGDQAAALLQELPSGKIENEEVRRFLVERLAELDPARAVELGKTLGDSKMMAVVVSVKAEEDAAAALALLKGLPADRAKEALSNVLQDQQAGVRQIKGSVNDFIRVLKDLPGAEEIDWKSWGNSNGLSQILGGLIARDAEKDPVAAIAIVKATAADLVSGLKQNGSNMEKEEAGLVNMMLERMLGRLRAQSPQTASVFFDAIPDGLKTAWMFPVEALSRYKSNGVDDAIALAEKQSNEEFARRAASGAWWGVAQQDRQTALTWIESLPQGAFRTGVLNAVMFDAWMQSMSWGSDKAAIEAGAKLLSKSSQMDYFASLMSDRRFSGRGSSPSELMDQLPISDADKAEIYRRIAPLRSK